MPIANPSFDVTDFWMPTKTILALGLVSLGFAIFISRRGEICEERQRISTQKAAIEFGKDLLRKDQSWWQGLGLDKTELEGLLSRPGCCNASELDPKATNGRAWRAFISAEDKRGLDLQFEASFSACASRVEVETLGTARQELRSRS